MFSRRKKYITLLILSSLFVQASSPRATSLLVERKESTISDPFQTTEQIDKFEQAWSNTQTKLLQYKLGEKQPIIILGADILSALKRPRFPIYYRFSLAPQRGGKSLRVA